MTRVGILCIFLMLLVRNGMAFRTPPVEARSSGGQRLNAKAINLDTGKEYEIEPGKPMSLAAVNTGLRLAFKCKAGNCGSCEFMLDGKKTRSCITKVPNKKSFTIKKK